MNVGAVLALCVVVILVIITVYMITMIWTNGCNSKYRKFRVCSTYYKDGKELHVVYWKLFWLWHTYYEDNWAGPNYATFEKKEDALRFIDQIQHPEKYSTIKKTEITEYKDE